MVRIRLLCTASLLLATTLDYNRGWKQSRKEPEPVSELVNLTSTVNSQTAFSKAVSRRVRILAIVPAYNEEDNIVSTVEDLLACAPDVDYLIVNDGSRDATSTICEERGYHVLSLPVNLGLAGAFQTGMRYACDHGYDYALQFDADGQHSAAYIHALLEEAERSDADIVIGSRFQTQKKPLSPRMLGSELITGLIFLTTGKRIQDPTSGMRLFSFRVMPLFANELDFGPEPDTISFLIKEGYCVKEVQVEMRDRKAGESYLTLTKSVGYMLRVGISILFVQWFRGKQ